MLMVLPANWLNTGSSNLAVTAARTKASRLRSSDSPINCSNNRRLDAPSNLWVPMVLILSTACAVARLAKLKVTISRIKTAIKENRRKLSIFPDSKPPGRAECR